MGRPGSPTHPFKAAGKWFKTKEEADAYKYLANLKRRAKRAGFGDSNEELRAFRKAEKLQQATIKKRKEIEARERAERDRLREENGLHPHAHVTGLYAAVTVREEGRKFLARSNRERMSDSERLNSMRALYRQRHQMSPADLLIRLGSYLGEEL